MIKDRWRPYRGKETIDMRRLLHEGRSWLESASIPLPDPHSWEDVAIEVQRSYPGGLEQLRYDLTTVHHTSYKNERYRYGHERS